MIELTGLRDTAAFGILYDERNPYFSGVPKDAWPGWVSVLQQLLADSERVVFRAISWQKLIPLLPTRGRSDVLAWAKEKHDLP